MLKIVRTNADNPGKTQMFDACVTIMDRGIPVPGLDDIYFNVETFKKLSTNKKKDESAGEQVVLPINMFFDTLDITDQIEIFKLYQFAKEQVGKITLENRRTIQDLIQFRVSQVMRKLDLDEKMIAFCKTDIFLYPTLEEVGTKPHHTEDKTFYLEEYVIITAISLFSKMMAPICGDIISLPARIGNSDHLEKIGFEIMEPSLLDGAFHDVYKKLYVKLKSIIDRRRTALDKNHNSRQPSSSFVLVRSGIDNTSFYDGIMATIIVKRMATYGCTTLLKSGKEPDAMVYIDDSVNRATDSKISAMRGDLDVTPRWELSGSSEDDNTSRIDHISRVGSRPIDIHVTVSVGAEKWVIPKLLIDTDTPQDVYTQAIDFYSSNTFEISPLTQAMLASFVGTRLGGSKCLNFLPLNTYYKLVTIMQIFMIKKGMPLLASLCSSRTSESTIDMGTSLIASSIKANTELTEEYKECRLLFKGTIVKPINPLKKNPNGRKQEVDVIGFKTLIEGLRDWIIQYSHKENMAPVLWRYWGGGQIPIYGSECKIEDDIIQHICKFYMIMHGPSKPF